MGSEMFLGSFTYRRAGNDISWLQYQANSWADGLWHGFREGFLHQLVVELSRIAQVDVSTSTHYVFHRVHPHLVGRETLRMGRAVYVCMARYGRFDAIGCAV